MAAEEEYKFASSGIETKMVIKGTTFEVEPVFAYLNLGPAVIVDYKCSKDGYYAQLEINGRKAYVNHEDINDAEEELKGLIEIVKDKNMLQQFDNAKKNIEAIIKLTKKSI
jgi:hypothetical protein